MCQTCLNNQKQLEQLIIKAIDLPTCPVKKEHAIAQRAWLKIKITELYCNDKQRKA